MERAPSQTRLSLETLRPLLKPQPFTGQMWVDITFLLLIGALHSTILPAMFGRYILIDLMTPWLVCTFVAAPLFRSMVLGTFGALILETHTACPAGMYMTAFWVIMSVLWLTRSTLSWRHAFPWAVTLFAAELWVISFETFVMAVSEGSFHISFLETFHQCVRLVVSTVVGMTFAQRFMRDGIAEEAA